MALHDQSAPPAPYPLVFDPILMPKVWGGDRLARFGKAVRPGDRVGESWELADLDATSAGGAGGGAARSIIRNGALAERAGQATLRDAMGLWGAAMLGGARPTSAAGFPLLVKYLDAREHLSVQVHPSPAYAASHAGAHLKTECWYILDAAPGSVIFKGVKPGVTRADFERALRSGTGADAGAGVVELLEAVPAIAGECHNLPSGTVHALGAGVLVAEVQTPSDTTFRVYDWAREYGRAGRELHVEQALACIDFGPAPRATSLSATDGGDRAAARLVTTEFFTLDAARARPEGAGAASTPGAGFSRLLIGEGRGSTGRAYALMLVSGAGRLVPREHARAAFDPVPLRAGDTALVPAAIADDAVFEPAESASGRSPDPSCILLRAGVGAA